MSKKVTRAHAEHPPAGLLLPPSHRPRQFLLFTKIVSPCIIISTIPDVKCPKKLDNILVKLCLAAAVVVVVEIVDKLSFKVFHGSKSLQIELPWILAYSAYLVLPLELKTPRSLFSILYCLTIGVQFGAADGAFLLQKERRTDNAAVLDISGRDQQDRWFYLKRDMDRLVWQLERTENELWREPPDPVLEAVAALVTSDKPEWSVTATDLTAALRADMKPNALVMRLNIRAGKLLNDYHIQYASVRT